MASRATWKGFIRLSLVSIPVKAYTASATGKEIRLNQLHEECHSPIRYRKTCPIHGEVENSEIVSGYEYAKGQYVVVDAEELDRLRPESDKSLTIDGFYPAGTVDPLYFTGKDYYLAPDGPMGIKPYVLVQRAMTEEGLHGVGQVVLFGREQIVALRPVEDLLVMSPLKYERQVKSRSEFEGDVKGADVAAKELELTKQLVESSTLEDFALSNYKDRYTERLMELVETKLAGKEVVAAPPAEEPRVIDLMDALKQSVERAGARGGKKAAKASSRKKKAAKKAAPSTRQRASRASSAKRKRKSG